MTKVKVSKGHRATVKQSNTADAQTPSNQDRSFCDQIAACPIIQSMQEAIENMVPGGADWSTIQNKPTSFPPSAHTHTIPDVSGLTAALAATASTAQLNAAITALKDGVPTAGDTLQKLYNLILSSQEQFTVANITERNALNVQNLNIQVFVTDDGDGKWAIYKPTTTGTNATYDKISDADMLNAVMSASQIKTAYESNPDTNAFTNALKSKLDSITAIFTTVLNDAYDTAATWVSTNSSAIATLLANTSGSNTGDETTATLIAKRPLKTLGGVSIDGTGNIPIGRQFFRWQSTSATIAASSGNRFSPVNAFINNATEPAVEFVVEQAMTLRQMIFRTSTAQPSSGSYVIAVRRNQADTALIHTIGASAGANTFTVTADVVLNAGDRVCLRLNNAASAPPASIAQFSLGYDLSV